MRILLLSQVFYPDVVAVAQYLTDLGFSLSKAGHEVTVLCSSQGYENSSTKFPRKEIWKGITVRRVRVLCLGKKSKIRRIVSSGSFFISAFMSLVFMPRQDVVVVVPPPPLLSVMAAIFARLRGGKLLYWNMDLNPDEAIAAGWMKPDSLAARILGAALRYSLNASSSIVVLDRFMNDRIVAKGIPEDKVHTVPVWSHDDMVCYDAEGRAAFRRQLGVEKKFVVMYSGNHSPLHPLDTVLQSALRLRENQTIAFVFVGGGSEFARVKDFAQEHSLSNVICVPYQPLDHLAGSLSAADLQVVLLGDPFVGIVHPCKIYNMLAVGLRSCTSAPPRATLRIYSSIQKSHRWVDSFAMEMWIRLWTILSKLASDFASGTSSRPGRPADLDRFSQASLMPTMIELVEATGHSQ